MRAHVIRRRRQVRARQLSTLAVLLLLHPMVASAQTEATADREIRVIETIDPDSGRRSLHVMEDLSPDEIWSVQRALRSAGFGGSWLEGWLDPFTRGALQRFQTHRGLAVCACVSLETLIELDLRARVAETIVLEEPRGSKVEDAREEAGPYDVEPGETAPTSVDYGLYYPYGVVFLAPYPYLYHDPVHGPRAVGPGLVTGRAAPGFAIGVGPGSVHAGGTIGPVPAMGRSPTPRALGPFPRVTPPPNVVRDGS